MSTASSAAPGSFDCACAHEEQTHLLEDIRVTAPELSTIPNWIDGLLAIRFESGKYLPERRAYTKTAPRRSSCAWISSWRSLRPLHPGYFRQVSHWLPVLPSGRHGDADLNQKFQVMNDFTGYLTNSGGLSVSEFIYCLAYQCAPETGCENCGDCQNERLMHPRTRLDDEISATWAYVDAT